MFKDKWHNLVFGWKVCFERLTYDIRKCAEVDFDIFFEKNGRERKVWVVTVNKIYKNIYYFSITEGINNALTIEKMNNYK